MKHKLNQLIGRIKTWLSSHRKQSYVGGAILLVVLAVTGLSIFGSSDVEQVSRTDPMQDEVMQEPEPELPTTVASPLTGVQVSEEEASRPVTAVVIENSPEARPQSSLSEAGFVFESIAEGGITRYVVMYQESAPTRVGPVRSLRPYFNDWIITFDASIAHVGGSAAALAEVGPLGMKDLDQFSHGGTYYRSSDRFAPHNVYTSFAELDKLNERLGYTSSTFTPFPRKAAAPAASAPAGTISVNISSYTYQSDYKWDRASNTYKRSVGGQAEVDIENDQQVAPSVVVVAEVENSVIEGGRYSYDLVGSGKVSVFQDGDVEVGTWSKTARDAQMTFTDDNGKEIKLNPGMVWLTAISPSREATYSP